MGIWIWLRGLFFAWLRFVAACLIVSTPITLTGAFNEFSNPYFTPGERVARLLALIGLGGFILLYGSPLVLAYRVIAQKRAPYLKWGYWLVVIYGPLLVYAVSRDFGQALGMGLIYEVAAAAVFAAYILVWRGGDHIAMSWRSRVGRTGVTPAAQDNPRNSKVI